VFLHSTYISNKLAATEKSKWSLLPHSRQFPSALYAEVHGLSAASVGMRLALSRSL
jgi:hypothetical protein